MDQHILLAERGRTISREEWRPSMHYSYVNPQRSGLQYPAVSHSTQQYTCTYPPHHWSFFDSAAPAPSTSEPITCPYSFTRLGSIRYIQRYQTMCQLPSAIEIHIASHLIQEDKKHDVVSIAICCQRHSAYISAIFLTGNRPNGARMAFLCKTYI